MRKNLPFGVKPANQMLLSMNIYNVSPIVISGKVKSVCVPDHVVTLAQDGTIPNMGWPNKELTTLSLLRPKIP